MPMRKRRSNGILSLLSPFLWAALLLIVLIVWQLIATLRHDTFFDAIRRNDSAAVNRFLRSGTDVNMRETPHHMSFSEYMNRRFSSYTDSYYPTPLLAALMAPENSNGNRATLQANSRANLAIIRALLEHGADVHATDINRGTSLSLAGRSGNVEIVDLLIRHGANVNEPSIFGQGTPLVEAAGVGREKVMRYLLDHRADINATNGSGETALIHTVKYARQTEAVQLLLERHIAVNAKDGLGKTALWHARHPDLGLSARQTQHLPEIITLLKQAGAK